MNLASWLFVFHLVAADDRCVMNAFTQLLDQGDLTGQREDAAFLVRESDGSWALVVWPRTNSFRRQTLRAAIPAGTVAIVHTHPLQMGRPSRGDLAEATRLGLPIYVLTLWEIWVADPSGKVVRLVGRPWSHGKKSCAPAVAELTRADLRLR